MNKQKIIIAGITLSSLLASNLTYAVVDSTITNTDTTNFSTTSSWETKIIPVIKKSQEEINAELKKKKEEAQAQMKAKQEQAKKELEAKKEELKNSIKSTQEQLKANWASFHEAYWYVYTFFGTWVTQEQKTEIKKIVDTKRKAIEELFRWVAAWTITKEDLITKATEILNKFQEELLPYVNEEKIDAFKTFVQEKLKTRLTNFDLRTQIKDKKDEFKKAIEDKKTETKNAIEQKKEEMKKIAEQKKTQLPEVVKKSIDEKINSITDSTKKQEFIKKLIENVEKLITSWKYSKLKPTLEQLKVYLQEKLNSLTNTEDVNNLLNDILDWTTN